MFKSYFYECNKQQVLKGTLRCDQKLMLNDVTNLKEILRVLKRFETEVAVSNSNCSLLLKELFS